MIATAHSSAAAGNFDQAAFFAALERANARSCHSYFNQHIVADDEAGFITVDEGDYGALPSWLADHVIETIPGRLCDDD